MSPFRFTCLLTSLLVCGCARLGAEVGEDEFKTAVLKIKSVNYFGGLTTTVTIKSNEAVYERVFPAITNRQPIKAKVKLTEKQRQAFRKIINRIAREQLWQQKDVTVKAVDGGERNYDFQVGKNKGHFKLINAAPKNLLPFITETQQLISSIERAAKD